MSRDGWAINSDPFCGGALVNSRRVDVVCFGSASDSVFVKLKKSTNAKKGKALHRHVVTAAHCTHGKSAADIAVTVFNIL